MDQVTGGLPDDLPVGRRVAYWRTHRGMSQQVFADRLGKSKSWVDKVERGVRRLDKVSVLREIADVLRISVAQLTGTTAMETTRDRTAAPGVEALRAALTRYEVQLGRRPVSVPNVDELERAVAHAWITLSRADYKPLLHGLPDLIGGAQWCHVGSRSQTDPRTHVLLGQVYQITADLLRRLGVHDLAWLAADRAMTIGAATKDPWWAARAAIPLADVLRETGRPRYGFEVCLATAHRLAGPDPLDGPLEYLAMYGALLSHAALATATCGDRTTTTELLDQAETAARAVDGRRDHHQTAFGPALVAVTRVAADVELGHGERALPNVKGLDADPQHQRLPAAVRAGHLLVAARAYLQAGEPTAAGRAIVAAARIAAGEVHARPVAHDTLGAVLRASPHPEPPVARLAETLGVTP